MGQFWDNQIEGYCAKCDDWIHSDNKDNNGESSKCGYCERLYCINCVDGVYFFDGQSDAIKKAYTKTTGKPVHFVCPGEVGSSYLFYCNDCVDCNSNEPTIVGLSRVCALYFEKEAKKKFFDFCEKNFDTIKTPETTFQDLVAKALADHMNEIKPTTRWVDGNPILMPRQLDDYLFFYLPEKRLVPLLDSAEESLDDYTYEHTTEDECVTSESEEEGTNAGRDRPADEK